jgi:hypothetical protein
MSDRKDATLVLLQHFLDKASVTRIVFNEKNVDLVPGHWS